MKHWVSSLAPVRISKGFLPVFLACIFRRLRKHRQCRMNLCKMQVLAVNRVSDGVSVVHSDGALLERGREVRALGVNIVVADLFDAGRLTLKRCLYYCMHGCLHP